jgi:threonine/homoserine/homoserine lactone efflux protein
VHRGGVTIPSVDVLTTVGSSLPAFALAVLLISVAPGPAMALILRRAALRGMSGALPTVLGLEAGMFVWALVAGTGFAALVAASELAYLVLRVVGAGVLLLLGVRAWLAAWRGTGEAPPEPIGPSGRRWWAAFCEGAVVQIANPKAAILMIAFYPQFVPADGAVFATTAVFGAVQVLLELVFYLALTAGVARAAAWFRRPRIRRRIEAVTGTVLIALGLRVAVSGT